MIKNDPFISLLSAGVTQVIISLDDTEVNHLAHEIAAYTALLEVAKEDRPFNSEEKTTYTFLKQKRKKLIKRYIKRTNKLLDK